MATWCVVGASRGIGLEFVRQILTRGDQVYAAVRDPFKASILWKIAASQERPGACELIECDVSSNDSIEAFVARLRVTSNRRLDYLVLNAGVMKYPNRATEISFSDFEYHLRTNTVGPILTAQKLLAAGFAIKTIVFISSDSGSATNFRDFEDGFGAYAASKAALNQMLRHMAAELKRKSSQTTVLAMHPGEVATDMGNVDLVGDIEGIMTPQESVAKMMQVIPAKTEQDSGTFWTWEGKIHPW